LRIKPMQVILLLTTNLIAINLTPVNNRQIAFHFS